MSLSELILFDEISFEPAVLTEKNSSIIIKEVTTKKQLKEFVGFTCRLYSGNRYYVPQLKKDIEYSFSKSKNAAFDYCEVRSWLAYKGERLVGRIAGIINHAFIEKWKKKYMRFGWIEFEEDEEIAIALLTQVESWAMERGMAAVHGPLGFTNFDHAGILVEGFDQRGTLATNYNYPYYPGFIEDAGYYKDVDWVEYKVKVPAIVPEKLVKMAAIVKKRYNLHTVKAVTSKDLLPYAKDIFGLVNDAYAGLYGTVPLTEKQIAYNTNRYFPYMRTDFVSLVLDEKGQLAALGITMPCLSESMQKAKGKLFPFGFIHILKAMKNSRIGELCLIAVRKDLQGKGVNAILMNELTSSYIKNRMEFAESNPNLEENYAIRAIWERYDAVQHKRRRCYIKFLQDEKT